MGGASSFLAILAIAGFLGLAWIATKLSRLAGVSSIVLEITTGVIFGPSIVGLVSPEYAECQHARHIDCKAPADLSYRVAMGLPLGEGLGMIANMDYCPRDQYHVGHVGMGHGDEHGDEGHVGMGHGDEHGDAHGDEEHGDAHGGNISDHGNASHGQDGVEHGGNVSEHGGAHGGNISGHGNASHAQEHGGAHAGGEEHGGAHGGNVSDHGNASHAQEANHSSVEEHPEVDEHPEGEAVHMGSHHRRLSGGGDYATYEECLVKSCTSEVRHHCSLTPDFFTLIGHTGVAMMIFESGMHFDFEKAGKVGPKACCVAVLGTILPLIAGTVLTVIFGKPFMPDGVSVGTALAPTSVGIALRLLGEAKVLQEDFGQAIITAAFVDDILSLVLFNVLFSLRGDFDVMAVVVNPIIGVVFMGIAMVAAVKFWPRCINEWILPRVPEKPNSKVSQKDEVLFIIMMALLVAYATFTHFLGTHLWGCFMAGMSFACISNDHHAHHVWVKQTKRATSWMIRIFFAATVAFSIPIGKLLSIDAFLKGSVMGIGPCILTKVLCAPFMGPAKFVIGWAMVGRAEFAYLIAQMAAAGNMMDEETFSIVIWALLYATIFAPIIFRKVLDRYVKTYCTDVLKDASDKEAEEGAAAH